MGRRKPGKPGRTPLPGLRGMHPPGELYERWYRVYDIGVSDADRRYLDSLGHHQAADAVEIAPLYSGHVPNAALALATMIRTDHYPIRTPEGLVLPVDGEHLARRLSAVTGRPPSRADGGRWLHRLHALGVLLVTVQWQDARPVTLLRFTRSSPALGGRWAWLDDLTAPDEMPGLTRGDVRELRAAEELAVTDSITAGATGAQAERRLVEYAAAILHQAGCLPAGACSC